MAIIIKRIYDLKQKIARMNLFAILFGTAGVPHSAIDRSREGGIRRIRELNLGALELEFVQGVRMGEEKARKVGSIAKVDNTALRCHAPYYINLNSRYPEKITSSRDRIIHTAYISQILGVRYFSSYFKSRGFIRCGSSEGDSRAFHRAGDHLLRRGMILYFVQKRPEKGLSLVISRKRFG